MHISEVRGVIFDVDDTLLDNNASPDPTVGLHARSRLAAVHEVGRRRNLPNLVALTPEQNVEAFRTAPTHSLSSAVWNILRMQGLAKADTPHLEDEILREIVELKNSGHEAILREHGKEVKDASRFIAALAANGLRNHLAIASSAVRRDIDIFFDMVHVDQYFSETHIISLEKVHPERLKPHPEAFNLAFLSLGLADTPQVRQQVLGFEDDPRGVVSAKAAGLYVCALTTKFTMESGVLQAAGADEIMGSFAEYGRALGLPEFASTG